MSLGAIFAVLFVVAGFIAAVSDGDFLLAPMGWFLAAVAAALVGGPTFPRRTS